VSSYRSVSFYTMRNDALDRFGTRPGAAVHAQQITDMMTCGAW